MVKLLLAFPSYQAEVEQGNFIHTRHLGNSEEAAGASYIIKLYRLLCLGREIGIGKDILRLSEEVVTALSDCQKDDADRQKEEIEQEIKNK